MRPLSVFGPSSGKLGAEPAVERAQKRHAGHDDAAVGLAAEDFLPAGRLGGELADDLLDDVLDGDEAQELAVLVDHEAEALAVVLELGELRQERRARGNEVGRAQERPQRSAVISADASCRLTTALSGSTPTRLSSVPSYTGTPRVVRGRELLAQERGLLGEVERVDAVARRHHVVDGDRLEVHQVREHRLVLAAEVLAAFEHERAQLFLRELRAAVGATA